MEIDIRKSGEVSKVTSIRFGETKDDTVMECGYGCISIAPEDYGEVHIKDIDNLILALQKAKELWGEDK